MATKNIIDKNTPEYIVCKFHDTLKDEQKLLESKLAATRTKIESAEILRGYALCNLAKTEETSDYYSDLDNYELLDMQKSAEIVKTDIGNLVKKDDELGKKITDASKLLNELKDNLHTANNNACTMRNCLQSHLGFPEHNPPEELKKVTDLAKRLKNNGKKAADSMVSVAGIHTFSSFEALEPFGVSVAGKISELKGWTDSLIEASKENEKSTQAELALILEELNAEEFEYFGTSNVLNAHIDTREFICDGKCQPIDCVEEICREISDCLSEAEKPTPSEKLNPDDYD